MHTRAVTWITLVFLATAVTPAPGAAQGNKIPPPIVPPPAPLPMDASPALVPPGKGLLHLRPTHPPVNELVILDPGAHPESLPAVQFRPTADGRLQVDLPPTLHVHRYYYSGPREYPAPYVAGGPTIVVANNPWTGQRMYIETMLPPGDPTIAYTKSAITYLYPGRRVTITFPMVFHEKAVVTYKGLFDVHCQKVSNQHGVPNARYGHDEERRAGAARTPLGTEDEVTLVLSAANPWDPAAPVRPTRVRRRQFKLSVPALEVDHIKLDQVALALYETGQIACSGRLEHLGAGYQGQQVILRLRAYGTFRDPANPKNIDGPLLWETAQSLWVTPGLPQVIPLAPGFCVPVRTHFNEITHLEVYLEYGRNR